METLADYVGRLLDGLFQTQVEPLAAAFDEEPDPVALEEGRRSAAERAGLVRAQLVAMCSAYAEAPPSRADALAAYEATKSLLCDLWKVVAADATVHLQGPAARVYAREALRRVA
jgi:hypothetical protein